MHLKCVRTGYIRRSTGRKHGNRELGELLEAWAMVMGRDHSNRAKLADVILKGSATVRPAGVVMEPTYPELYSALEALAYRSTGKRGQKPDARLLGNYLRKFKGKIVDGKRLAMKAEQPRGGMVGGRGQGQADMQADVQGRGLKGLGGLWGSLSRAWGEMAEDFEK
jgi:hypothetical protein